MVIPENAAEKPKDEKIPQEVAELPQEAEPIETEPYVLSFAKYNNRICEINNLKQSSGKKILDALKNIGMNIFSLNDFGKNNIKIKNVTNEGDYKKLFSKLSPETELKEVVFGSSERIFFFTFEPNRIIYIITIKATHFDTTKNRR